MRKHVCAMLSVMMLSLLSVFSAPAVHAQAKDLTGVWQGALELGGGQKLRTVLKIGKDDKGAYKVDFYSIDQRSPAIPVKMSQDGASVKMSIAAVGGTYEAKVTADGSEMDGTFSQGEGHPLVLKRVNASDAWAIPEPPAKVPPMDTKAEPGFEVATIKPTAPDEQGQAFLIQGANIRVVNQSLSGMIAFAYGVQKKQVTGGAAWMETDKFDVSGKPDVAGQPNSEQFRAMLRKLIVERFGLKFHEDKKELSVYALSTAKGGPKLTAAATDAGAVPGLFFRGLGQLVVRNATLGDFSHLMQEAVLDRPVVDHTGVTGRWNWTLNWTPDESQFGGMGAKVPPPSDKADAPPPLFTAIQEQIGLKLDATREPVTVMVIDHVEKPSAN